MTDEMYSMLFNLIEWKYSKKEPFDMLWFLTGIQYNSWEANLALYLIEQRSREILTSI